jgi:rubrerythrin
MWRESTKRFLRKVIHSFVKTGRFSQNRGDKESSVGLWLVIYILYLKIGGLFMKSIKGTKTEKNVLTAFAGESQARNRYTYFASVAKKEGYVQISKIFEETADQEKEHAKRLFKFLEGGEVEITAAFPAGVIAKKTTENLTEAAGGEDYEWQTMYPSFAKVAREEGFEEISSAMEHIAIAEKGHAKRYKALTKNINEGKVFKKDTKVTWRCLNCGYIHENSAEAPQLCPACAHPQAHFELLCENW